MKTISETLGTGEILEVGQTIIYQSKEYGLCEIDLMTGTAWLLPRNIEYPTELDLIEVKTELCFVNSLKN